MTSKELIEEYTKVAAQVLAMCKSAQPSFYTPQPVEDPVTGRVRTAAQSWGYLFAKRPYIKAAYYEAVGSFYSSPDSADGKRPEAPDIIKHAKQLTAAWRNHPVHGPEIRQREEAAVALRDEQIRNGTFGQLRGVRRKELTGPSQPVNLQAMKAQALEFIQQGQQRFKGTPELLGDQSPEVNDRKEVPDDR